MKPNKTYTFDALPLLPPTVQDDPESPSVIAGRTFVRTGTYADGNCFFHALLRAIDIQYRKQTTHYAHLRLVETFRKNLAEWVTPEVFQQLGDGEQLRLFFLTEFNQLLQQSCNQSEDSILAIVHKLLPYSVIDREIIPFVLNKHGESFYKLFCWEAEKYVREKLAKLADSSKLQAICNRMRTHFIDLFKQAHVQALEHFRMDLQRMGEFTSSFQMECISKFTGYNFVFIHGDDGDNRGYSGISHVVNFDENRKTLIFLWINDNHYEIIGELENKNVVNRIFASDDPLVQALIEQHANQ